MEEQLEDELIRLRAEIQRTAELKSHFENEYQRSQKRFRTIFEDSPLGNKIINDRLEIIKVNASFVQILGFTERELAGHVITDFARSDFVNPWKELQHEIWTTGRPSFAFEACLIKKDGSSIWCHVNTILIEDDGKTLGYTILEDITEAKQLAHLKSLLLEKKHHRDVAETIFTTQEQERKRIGEDLHNSLGQHLYGLKLSLNQLKVKGDQCEPANGLAIREAEEMINTCILECRRISHGLTPSILEDYGLNEALKDACQRLSKEVIFKCVFKGYKDKLNKVLAVAIYRIIQEAMTNVIKHSKATEGTATIDIGKNKVTIVIKDNGIGFDPKLVKRGIGLNSIDSKVRLLNGEFTIASFPGEGTILTIVMPRLID